MSYSEIQSAFFTEWAANNSFGMTTFFPDRDYTPTTEHCRLFFLPSERVAKTLGADGSDDIVGVFQIDLKMQTGKGNGELLEKVDSILSAFNINKVMPYNDARVRVLSTAFKNLGSIDGFLTGVISIEFSSYFRRA